MKNRIRNSWNGLTLTFFTHELFNMNKTGLLQYDIEEVLGDSTLLVKMKESGEL